MDNPYSRLLGYEVWNFMSIEHGKVEFDDTNIINFKGYNDSGKSAMRMALKILLCNSDPQKQVGFIQDDKDYFRIVAYFDDGVYILRDKYLNGQSLYEMYKGETLLYTTKSGNTLTKVTDVPKPIADYLGLITYDNVCLNARACFDKQIGVETTGSENYKMFNTVLKSEEIASAGSMLNTDSNKLLSDISALNSKLDAYTSMCHKGVTEEMVSYLKDHDKELDDIESRFSSVSKIRSMNEAVQSIMIYPELTSVDMTQLSSVNGIKSLIKGVRSINIAPELKQIETGRINAAIVVKRLVDSLENLNVVPELCSVDTSQLCILNNIQKMYADLSSYDDSIKDCDIRVNELQSELMELQASLSDIGVKMIRCPNCGELINPESVGEHIEREDK